MIGNPKCPWNWKHLICDTEDDLPNEDALFSPQPGDEAFIKSNSKVYIRNNGKEWIERMAGITSSPPSGKYKVTNLYVDPITGKLEVEYDDNPVP